MIPKRVKDKQTGELGWAVESFGRGRYRVEWDSATSHQHTARPEVPGCFVDWAESGAQLPSATTTED